MEVDAGLYKFDDRWVLMPTRMWTFIRIDETCAGDPPNWTWMAVEARPTRVWVHRESAIRAAEEDWEARRRSDGVPHLPWVRHALDDDGTVYAEPDLRSYYQVYPLTTVESEG